MKTILSLLILALLCIHPAGAQANPTAAGPFCLVFIKVYPNGELTIVERLKGFGPELQRPLSKLGRPYASQAPFVEEPFMELVQATADGRPVTPSVQSDQYNNRTVRLTAPDPSRELHEYTLTYKARDRILFQSDVDRLDWDIWGTSPGAGLQVSCAIELPEGATVAKQWSRLGHETTTSRPVTQWINKKGVALFRGEEPLGEREYFVVSVEWNKGIVQSDGSEQKIFVVQSSLWGLFALLLLICGGLWFKYGKDPYPKTSTPLFYPPLGPDGKVLSPAAMAYIHNAAFLPSRGFAGLLLNLAAQKMINLSGAGTRKDPYILQTSNAVLQRVRERAAQQDSSLPGISEGSSRKNRRIWEETLARGCGFDTAERDSLLALFPPDEAETKNADLPAESQNTGNSAGQPEPIRIDGSYSWLMAKTRAAAYMALGRGYRDMWYLRGGMVFAMFMLCYVSVTLVQALIWYFYGGGSIAVTLTVITAVGGLSAACYYSMRFIQRTWVKWQEMGPRNLALAGLYVLLLPIIILYDCILDQSMADFFLYEFMHMWQLVRIPLWLGLMGYLFFLTRSPWEVLITPLKVCGFLTLFFLAGGMTFYTNSFAGSANLAFLGILLLPLFLMPFMKQPAQKAMQVLADIKGLAMYIGAAEAQRLNFINPPERTPEEFHRLMPYAVALGLEKAWGAQFADMFAEMRFHGSSLNMLAEYEHRISGK